MIFLNQIVKQKTRAGEKLTVLDHLNLTVNEGEFISVVGFNKCGKTALIKILALLDREYYGNYQFNGLSLNNLSEKDFQGFRIKNIGLVYKNYNLVDYFTICENILLPLKFSTTDKRQIRDRAGELCHQFKIDHKKKHLSSQVSQLIRTKAAIAQSLMLSPKILLADDIFNGLDNEECRSLIDLLAELNDGGLTVVLTSENLQDANLFHRKIFIHEGKIFTDYPFA